MWLDAGLSRASVDANERAVQHVALGGKQAQLAFEFGGSAQDLDAFSPQRESLSCAETGLRESGVDAGQFGIERTGQRSSRPATDAWISRSGDHAFQAGGLGVVRLERRLHRCAGIAVGRDARARPWPRLRCGLPLERCR